MNRQLRFLYQLGLAGTGAFMPFLHVGMSVGTIWTGSVLFLHILFETHRGFSLPDIVSPIRQSKPALLLLAFFIMHGIWLAGTEDFHYAFNDIRIKLPLFVFAVVCGILPPLSRAELRILMLVFGISVTLALLACVYKSIFEPQPDNIRDAAGVFISHIRFGLMSGMSVGIWLWLWNENKNRLLFPSLLLLSLLCQWHLGMVTGLVTSAVVIFTYGLTMGKMWRLVMVGSVVLLGLVFGIFAFDYFTPKEEFSSGRTHTKYGEQYISNTENRLLENGYYVWNHVAPAELESAWAKVSSLGLEEPDGRGNKIKGTLIRYLTSLGLTKDAEGIAQLTPQQIREIEAGVASPKTEKMTGMRRRLYEIFFEWDAYRNGANPSGNSLTQRVAFQKAAIDIIIENPVFGVGTGDVKSAFDNYYVRTNSLLEAQFRLRAHQQYLTVMVAFGVVGLILFLGMLWWAPFRCGLMRDYLPLAFILLVSLSFLTEDTLETQAGATFFAWFYGVLIIAGRQVFGPPEPA